MLYEWLLVRSIAGPVHPLDDVAADARVGKVLRLRRRPRSGLGPHARGTALSARRVRNVASCFRPWAAAQQVCLHPSAGRWPPCATTPPCRRRSWILRLAISGSLLAPTLAGGSGVKSQRRSSVGLAMWLRAGRRSRRGYSCTASTALACFGTADRSCLPTVACCRLASLPRCEAKHLQRGLDDLRAAGAPQRGSACPSQRAHPCICFESGGSVGHGGGERGASGMIAPFRRGARRGRRRRRGANMAALPETAAFAQQHHGQVAGAGRRAEARVAHARAYRRRDTAS